MKQIFDLYKAKPLTEILENEGWRLPFNVVNSTCQKSTALLRRNSFTEKIRFMT